MQKHIPSRYSQRLGTQATTLNHLTGAAFGSGFILKNSISFSWLLSIASVLNSTFTSLSERSIDRTAVHAEKTSSIETTGPPIQRKTHRGSVVLSNLFMSSQVPS
jgi:hypothetical protein